MNLPGDDVMRRAVRSAWTSLPLYLLGSLVVASALAVTMWMAPGVNLLSVMSLCYLVTPLMAPMIRATQVFATSDDTFRLRDYVTTLPTGWTVTVRLASPIMGVLALTAVAFTAWQSSGIDLFLVPLGVGASITVVGVLGFLMAFPLALEDRRRSLGYLWIHGLHLAARGIVPTVAIVATIGLGLWLLLTVSAGLLVVLPGAIAVVWTVAFLTAQSRSHLTTTAP